MNICADPLSSSVTHSPLLFLVFFTRPDAHRSLAYFLQVCLLSSWPAHPLPVLWLPWSPACSSPACSAPAPSFAGSPALHRFCLTLLAVLFLPCPFFCWHHLFWFLAVCHPLILFLACLLRPLPIVRPQSSTFVSR